MIAYSREEIVPAARVVRGFSEILNKLKSRKLQKIAISRNNVLESIIIPIEEYERLQEVYDLVEHIDIYRLVKEREKTDIQEFIPLEQILKENDLL